MSSKFDLRLDIRNSFIAMVKDGQINMSEGCLGTDKRRNAKTKTEANSVTISKQDEDGLLTS